MTTITDEQRQRLISGTEIDDATTEEQAVHVYRRPRSGVIASLLGMLAGLGVLVIIGALTSSVALIAGFDLDLSGDAERLSIAALVVLAVSVVMATFTGGFVSGRIARYGGMATGLGSTLWLLVVLAVFGALALVVNESTPVLGEIDIAERFAMARRSELAVAGAIAGGGLLLLGLGMGLVGGRVGETESAGSTRDADDVHDV